MTAELNEEIEEKRARLQRLVGTGPSSGPTEGINHLAVFALDLDATADFYINVMGMPVTFVTANRDEPQSTHMNVDIGNGVSLSFFDFPPRGPLKAARARGRRRPDARGRPHLH